MTPCPNNAEMQPGMGVYHGGNACRGQITPPYNGRNRRAVWEATYQKMRSSREPCGPGGKNQKKSCMRTQGAVGGQLPISNAAHMGTVVLTLRVSLAALLIGRSPDQLGPTSQSTSGIVVPST